MPIVHRWRSYILGQPEPDYQVTETLDDGFALDVTTHANGNTMTGPSSDWHTSFWPSVSTIAIVDCEVDCDPAFVATQMTISANSGAVASGEGGQPLRTLTIDKMVGGLWTPEFTGLMLSAFYTHDFIPQETLEKVRVRVSIGPAITSGLPSVDLNVYDIRLIGAFCTVPSVPQGFTAVMTRQPDGTAKATLNWTDAVSGDLPITYRAYQLPETAGAAILVGTKVTGVDFPPYQVEVFGLNQNQEYCFVIGAQNACGIGVSTNTLCVTIESVVNPPNNFRGVEECEGNQITLYWEAPLEPPDVEGYRIRRDGVLVATLSDTTFEWLDTSPGIGVQHVYVLTAYNSAGDSPPATLTKIACEWDFCVEEPAAANWSIIQ